MTGEGGEKVRTKETKTLTGGREEKGVSPLLNILPKKNQPFLVEECFTYRVIPFDYTLVVHSGVSGTHLGSPRDPVP